MTVVRLLLSLVVYLSVTCSHARSLTPHQQLSKAHLSAEAAHASGNLKAIAAAELEYARVAQGLSRYVLAFLSFVQAEAAFRKIQDLTSADSAKEKAWSLILPVHLHHQMKLDILYATAINDVRKLAVMRKELDALEPLNLPAGIELVVSPPNDAKEIEAAKQRLQVLRAAVDTLKGQAAFISAEWAAKVSKDQADFLLQALQSQESARQLAQELKNAEVRDARRRQEGWELLAQSLRFAGSVATDIQAGRDRVRVHGGCSRRKFI